MDFNSLVTIIARYSPVLAGALTGNLRNWLISILTSTFKAKPHELSDKILQDDHALEKLREIEQLYKNITNHLRIIKYLIVSALSLVVISIISIIYLAIK